MSVTIPRGYFRGDGVFVPDGGGMTTGSNANGTFHKFDNGILICVREDTVALSTTIAEGGGFIRAGDPLVFAHAFISPPNVSCGINFTAGGSGLAVSNFQFLSDPDYNTQCNPVYTSFVSGSTGRRTFHAVGRWK